MDVVDASGGDRRFDALLRDVVKGLTKREAVALRALLVTPTTPPQSIYDVLEAHQSWMPGCRCGHGGRSLTAIAHRRHLEKEVVAWVEESMRLSHVDLVDMIASVTDDAREKGHYHASAGRYALAAESVFRDVLRGNVLG